MSDVAEAQGILRRAGGRPDRDVDLAETALALGALDVPDARLNRYRHHLSLLTRDVAEAAAAAGTDDLAARARALAEVLVERYGYQGDRETYNDLQNANLLRVIDRRRGLPVALAILFVHAGRAQGWQIDGLNFPGHFLISMSLGPERAVLDPFDGLRPLGAHDLRQLLKAIEGADAELSAEHYAPLGNRAMLLRLQNNRKVRLLHDEHRDLAVQTLEAMLMIAPGEPSLWHEAGLLHAHQGNLRAAVLALEQVMQLSPDPNSQRDVAHLLKQLRGRIK
jgi:regulator of sirC expression with transglutaminase-like and TPR domain